MATAWGPQISFGQVTTVTVADATETPVASAPVNGLGEVVRFVALIGSVEINADADATAVALKLYRGDLATGENIWTGRVTSDQLAGNDNIASALWVDIPPATPAATLYTLTVAVLDASGASSVGDCTLLAIAF